MNKSCIHCGALISDWALYCRVCGASQAAPPPTYQAQAPSAPTQWPADYLTALPLDPYLDPCEEQRTAALVRNAVFFPPMGSRRARGSALGSSESGQGQKF